MYVTLNVAVQLERDLMAAASTLHASLAYALGGFLQTKKFT